MRRLIEPRLLELEQEFQLPLAKAACDFSSESYTEDFKALAEEMASLKEKRKNLDMRHKMLYNKDGQKLLLFRIIRGNRLLY